MWNKSYKNTKAEIKKIVINAGLDRIDNYIWLLKKNGHTEENINKALDYFRYNKQTEKYRRRQE